MSKTFFPLAVGIIAVLLESLGNAQELSSLEPPQLASPAQRLMMEQVDELIEAGEIDEALNALEKLFDEAEGRLVPVPQTRVASTLTTRRYIPLAHWTGITTLNLLNSQPQAAARYQLRKQELAAGELQQLLKSKDPIATKRAAQRYYATDLGIQLQLLLSDLYLEQGWGVAALQPLQHVSTMTRYQLEAGGPQTLSASLPWPFVWQQIAGRESAAALLAEWRQSLQEATRLGKQEAEKQLAEALGRMLIATALNPAALDPAGTRNWVAALLPALSEANARSLSKTLQAATAWPTPALERDAVDSFSSTAHAGVDASAWSPAIWPDWTQSLERYAVANDHLPASKPRVGETERGTLPYFPVVKDGRVYVNEMTRIVAYDLESGEPWPEIRPPLPLFDSQLAPAAYLPLGYPLVGVPRGTLEIVGDHLYARVGSPITGRANPPSHANLVSQSYIVGLDLAKQGSLLPGFPLHLSTAEFKNGEFEGPPLVWGNLLLVPIAERDNVGLRRRVAAFDRFSGELVWKTDALAVGSVIGSEKANLIAHQMLTLAGGRLYYNTNLGSIVCLDPLTGATQWLVRYSRPAEGQAYPGPDRFRYRELTPCLLSGGLVYCAPQDAPEIFALDATTGDLAWATDDVQVADAVHLLGVHEDSLIVSGDRLVWLNRLNGRVLGRFPASTTPGAMNALPSPRGLGRGAIALASVYWPVAGEIFVFSASVPSNPNKVDAPTIRERIKLDTRGSEGGNLLFAGDWMLVSSPSRLLAFQVSR